MPKTEQSNLAQLRNNLNTYFDKSEIRSLCFDLSVDYDNLPEAKEDAIRELVRYLARRQQIDALVAQCRQLRKRVPWPDIPPEEITALLYRPAATSRTLSKREMQERQKQLVLLEKVKNFWVKGVLERSVPDTRLMDLGRQQYSDAVDHPWHKVVGTAVYDTHSLSAYKNILDTFVESDRALLILGGPGAGKTTTLLELTRELITLAEQDPAQPIPVVLNLSSPVFWFARRCLSDGGRVSSLSLTS